MKSIAVIPCYNEEQYIFDLVKRVRQYVDLAIVTDDNSKDNTVEMAKKSGASVVVNSLKRGMGFNTKIGFDNALSNGCDIVVTLDGDGQHNPDEIDKVVTPIINGEADLVIGSRFLNGSISNIPKYRKFGIGVITSLYNLGNKNKITDAQCCFRAYKKDVLKKIQISEAGFPFSIETLVKARESGFRIKEVPVNVLYHEKFSNNSTLNPIRQGLDVAFSTVRIRLKIEVINKLKSSLFGWLMKYMVHPMERRGLGKIKFIDVVYKNIFSVLVPEKEDVVSINGYKMVVKTGGKWGLGGIGKNLAYVGEYEPQTTEVFKTFIKPNMKVIDVGANQGYFTVLSSKLVGDGGKVWAFEPESRNFSILTENININNIKNVIPVNKAVSNTVGKAQLYVSEWERGESSIRKGVVRTKQRIENIETVILNNEINDSIDFLKTDTEGNEFSVLKGATKLLSNKDIKLVVELFPQSYKFAQYGNSDLKKIFDTFDFKYIYIIDEIGHKLIRIDLSDTKYNRYSGNILCSKSEVSLL
jgi:FkbM family methyltransferase